VRWNYALVFTPVWMATRIGAPAAPLSGTHVPMQSRSRAVETTFMCTPGVWDALPFIRWRNGVRCRLSEH
jgi:hypothetical protein